MSNKVKSQKPISKEDLYKYVTYLVTGVVEDEKHGKELRRLARRTTTLSDVSVIIRVLIKDQESTLTQLMDSIMVQQRVLEKLGATEKMFKDAEQEHKKKIEQVKKELKEQLIKQQEEQEQVSQKSKATKWTPAPKDVSTSVGKATKKKDEK